MSGMLSTLCPSLLLGSCFSPLTATGSRHASPTSPALHVGFFVHYAFPHLPEKICPPLFEFHPFCVTQQVYAPFFASLLVLKFFMPLFPLPKPSPIAPLPSFHQAFEHSGKSFACFSFLNFSVQPHFSAGQFFLENSHIEVF